MIVQLKAPEELRDVLCGSEQTYMDFLQSGNKQMCDLCRLAESKACDGAGSLVQSQSFAVAISGNIAFGQNHTAICEACQTTQQPLETGMRLHQLAKQ